MAQSKLWKQIQVSCSQGCQEAHPKNNKHGEIFNTPMAKTSNNNPKVLSKIIDNNDHKCNGRPKPNCPLNGQCLTQFLTYKVTSGTSNNRFDY